MLSRCEQFCLDSGLPVVTQHGQKYASMYKPCVIEHPITKEHALAFNYSVELMQVQDWSRAIQRVFLPDYSSKEWLLHRLSWRFPLIGVLDKLDVLSRDPGTVWRTLFRKPFDACVGEIFNKEATDLLAMSIRNRYSSFKWRAGDRLIVDNLKMAHSGMPGSGARTLRVLLCNPIRMRYDSKGPGVHVVSVDSHHPTLGAQLTASSMVRATVGKPSPCTMDQFDQAYRSSPGQLSAPALTPVVAFRACSFAPSMILGSMAMSSPPPA